MIVNQTIPEHLRWQAEGFDAVTVDEIAGEADVSRRTFFRLVLPNVAPGASRAASAGPAPE